MCHIDFFFFFFLHQQTKMILLIIDLNQNLHITKKKKKKLPITYNNKKKSIYLLPQNWYKYILFLFLLKKISISINPQDLLFDLLSRLPTKFLLRLLNLICTVISLEMIGI